MKTTKLSMILAVILFAVGCNKENDQLVPQEHIKNIDLSYASSIFIGPNVVDTENRKRLYKVTNENEIDTVTYTNNFDETFIPQWLPTDLHQINNDLLYLGFQGVENYILDNRNGNTTPMQSAPPISGKFFFCEQFIPTSAGVIYLGNDSKLYSIVTSENSIVEVPISTAHDGAITGFAADPRGNILYSASVDNFVEIHLQTANSSKKIDTVNKVGFTVLWNGLNENELFYYKPVDNDNETNVQLVDTDQQTSRNYGDNRFVLSCGLSKIMTFENKVMGIGCNEIYELVNTEESEEVLITSLRDFNIINNQTTEKSKDKMVIAGINTTGNPLLLKIDPVDYSSQHIMQFEGITVYDIASNDLGESIFWGTSQHNGKTAVGHLHNDGTYTIIEQNIDGTIDGIGKMN
ncbi:hypothetical protein [Flammeovirga sp. SJP92]|uniref:hypothetical protein n=1 Tax=Flammeovirga sp. SJP92 TaxID=1775430 RepID=UPI0012F8A9CB|nr:hypothetical protein [Flammeovirga sp. SJP92]